MPVPLMGESVNNNLRSLNNLTHPETRSQDDVREDEGQNIARNPIYQEEKPVIMEVCIIERIFWQWWGRGEAVKLKHAHETWNML